MDDTLTISIDGDLAAQHLLALYEGSESLAGIGLTYTRVGHYLLTGEVRHRAPYDPRLKLLARLPRPGSVELDFIALLTGPAPTTWIGQIGISVSAGLILALGTLIIRKIVGSTPKQSPSGLEALVDNRPGDVDALASANVGSMKRAHSVIGRGATVINISGCNNNVILNQKTKDYVHTTISSDEPVYIIESIGWLNANTCNGGAYVEQIGRVVPFDMSGSLSDKSLRILLDSLSNYTLGRTDDSLIRLRVLPSCALDGTVKRYTLLEAELIEESHNL